MLSAFGELTDGINYLSEDNIIFINKSLIELQTPDEQIGVIKPNELGSSQSRPAQVRYYEKTEDMFRLSSVLIDSLIKNHPFANANKRTAMMSGYIFLLMNGYEFTAPDSEIVEMALGIATGEYNDIDLENWLCHWSRPFDARALCIPLEKLIIESIEN